MYEKACIALAEVINLPAEKAGEVLLSSFNPFTDANDDYAVLEFLIRTVMGTEKEPKELWLPKHQYQIGDYARAACAVLEIEYESSTESS